MGKAREGEGVSGVEGSAEPSEDGLARGAGGGGREAGKEEDSTSL